MNWFHWQHLWLSHMFRKHLSTPVSGLLIAALKLISIRDRGSTSDKSVLKKSELLWTHHCGENQFMIKTKVKQLLTPPSQIWLFMSETELLGFCFLSEKMWTFFSWCIKDKMIDQVTVGLSICRKLHIVAGSCSLKSNSSIIRSSGWLKVDKSRSLKC